MAITVALVRDTVARERTGSAMGQLGTMSAIGTALGPSLGGVLLAGFGWRAIFLVMVPLGILNVLLVLRHLPAPAEAARSARNGHDSLGTLLLGLSLAAYSLAMTVGGGRFERFNLVLLVVAVLGGGLFALTEARVASPLIRLAEFRNLTFDANLLMNTLVSTVMMATLVVGPFFLSRVLGLGESLVGAVMAVGPVVSALTGVPAGRITDRFGASPTAIAGLVNMTAGAVGLSVLPALFGTAGYVAALVVLTPGYQLFQAANNTAVMMDVVPDQRGVISGMLGLSRNLGLITGATVMGAVFAATVGGSDIMAAQTEAVAAGMRATFALAAMLIVVAIVMAVASRALVTHAALVRDVRAK